MNKFLYLVILIVGLWALSIFALVVYFGIPNNLSEAGEMFGGVNALFTGLALAGVAYTNWLQNIQIKTHQKNIEFTMESTQHSLEIMALSSLVQECDAALSRYERWAKSSDKDYSNTQKKVRESLKSHREKLENKLEQLQNS